MRENNDIILVMEQSKVKYFKEKQLEKQAQNSFENINNYAQNPIQAKFLAFRKTKKEINPKDLL